MAGSWAGTVILVVVVVVVVVACVSEVPMGRGDMSHSQCKEEQRLLVNACRAVIFGRSPSPSGCERVRVTHVECVCPVITPQLAALIGVERTIKQVEGCGRTIPHNFKCVSLPLEKGIEGYLTRMKLFI